MTEQTAPRRPDEDSAALAELLGSVVRTLEPEPDVDSTLENIVRAVVAAVPGTEHAGVTLLESGRLRSVAPTGAVVAKLDRLQEELSQGPCVDAVFDRPVYRTGDIGADERWPEFAGAAAGLGIASMLGIRLFTKSANLGALNLYSTEFDAFDDEAEHISTLFAAHAAVALTGSQRQEQLRNALQTRDTISMAKGILMERHRITDEQAFSLLVSASQRSNRKLHDIALWLVKESNARHDA
ncbi:GAF and ANTAR domain-containing protein [Amycolatopsis acidicola]|uniref:GAF and ANTAR domain-containing protein n=1 Tax=Amycolatopsis acidicola TaxID=2596893 RepID=A0A5N0UMY6_9PSEU|nr:GAF and ANTAR domain-containing protein [Amycolatopsis acidicola]KAA9149221.1 GAF and ANTAR domain-containing protein [Amycolatopsis acidicola]